MLQSGKIIGEVAGSQQGGGISAHGIKGDIAQIQQPGKAHHNIQPQGQHNIEQGHIDDAHPSGAAQLFGHKRQHRQQCNAHDNAE